VNDLEKALAGTFARAAAQAPTASPDFIRSVTARQARRRRAHVAMLAAAAAVIVVVAGTVVGTRVFGPTERLAAPAATPTSSLAARTPPVVDKIAPTIRGIWPGAVHTVPRTLPNGKEFNPDAVVDGRVVVGMARQKMVTDGVDIWSYTLTTRRFARIARFTPSGVGSVPTALVGDGVVVVRWTSRSGAEEVWSVPITGGEPRKVTSLAVTRPGDTFSRGLTAEVADGKVLLNPWQGGVYQAPLSGGEARLIPGTRGYHLLRWPWAVRPEAGSELAGWSARPPGRRLLDLRDGSRHDAANLPRGLEWKCGVTWCIGGGTALRRDGTGARVVPGVAYRAYYGGDVFSVSQTAKDGKRAMAIFDPATGRTGSLPYPPGQKRYPTMYSQDDLMYYKWGKQWLIVDLTAIR